jgi:tetratricopeptide (TPR) repeat protein
MLTDRQGNALPGATREAVDSFDQAVEAFNLYRGDPLGLLERAIATAPTFAMAQIAKAHILGLSTEPQATAQARAVVAKVREMRLDERESSHVAALDRMLDGNWTAAALALGRHNARYPHDLVALQAGHSMDFFRANARELRDRIARVLPKWSPELPGHSILLGMYAFGLEECGDYARAEDEGRRAVAIQPLDCWAHHAVAHVMEMQGRAEDGIGWMIAREPHWSGDDNLFKVHNWWHRALCHLSLNESEEALALYDGPIRETRSAVALDLVDASALLWRMHLLGSDVGDRWRELASTWDQHADGQSYAFNDWHAVMAYLGAGRDREVERLLAAYRAGRGSAETAEWARDVGLPLIEGFVSFWRGDYETAAERLFGARHIVNCFGGSHAQRDAIDWTLGEAALLGGFGDLAEALANERLALKPHSNLNRSLLSRARDGSARSADRETDPGARRTA